ncbi:hypothetical protein [Clostridium beijerinckii]|uniref:hypothetical protein n=1 Tax=Clostridium beijerinckii TaxID=1520 RepID=UPI00156D7D14|nr:hypothetical protein [Clostridium beijerinckii]NRU52653.1 hypothetical protein [Clostridium beijerinckii]NYC68696.1 hypothetical protein [Clostridium beijerinckii]NYC91845.1 hypothetical protein [Clostridium beijerinckii]
MNEKFEQFKKELENKTPEELEQGYNNFIKAVHNLPIDYEESMKELAKVRGKDENHYLNNDKIEFENGSVIQPIKIKGKITRSCKANEIIYEKELFIVNYKYRLLEILDSEYEIDTILVKAWDNKDVHKYMDNFRQEFIDCGYDMQYSFQKVGDGNFVEV